ncbi:MAG: hypothetical protein AAFQ52_02400 [Chloroflexota bacterium]
MTDGGLQQFIYGYPIISNQPAGTPDVLAISPDLAPSLAQAIIDSLPLAMPDHVNGVTYALTVIPTDDTGFVFTRAHHQTSDTDLPVRQSIVIPEDTLNQIGDFNPLIPLFTARLSPSKMTNVPLEPITPPTTPTWTRDQNITLLRTLISDTFDNNTDLLFSVLSALLQGDLIVQNFPSQPTARLAFVRGLWLLLPTCLRSHITFTTLTAPVAEGSVLPRLRFDDTITETDASAPIIDWANPTTEDAWVNNGYAGYLRKLYAGDMPPFVDALQELDVIATALREDNLSFEEHLRRTVERHQFDRAALSGETLAVNDMLTALQSDVPMSSELRTAYLINLLESNFASRDTQTARVIASEIDEDQRLDRNLTPFFASALEEQPDAFYAFVRARLADSDDDDTLDPKWIARLHDAAKASVQIAIESQNPDMIRSWLTLIAREPLRYDLSDVLAEGLSSAVPYAYTNADLATELVRLAVKRQPEMPRTWLSDEQFSTALPDNVRLALVDLQSATIETLANEDRDLFLLAVKRAVDSGEALISSAIIRALWRIHTQENTRTLPPQFRPITLIMRLAECPDCFLNGAMTTQLALLLADRNSADLRTDMLPLLSQNEGFSDAFKQALQNSGRDSETILQLLSQMLSNEWVTAQDVVDIYTHLLNARQWDTSAVPFAEQLARVMTQYPETDAITADLWQMLTLSAEYKNEQMLKVATRGLLSDIREMPSEVQVINSIQRLRKDGSWSTTTRPTVLRWWREFVRTQGIGQLQKLDKAFDGKRTLEDLRAVVQTVIAMRRVIGERTLNEFAAAVTTTYNLLQALSEGFDPNEKLVDSVTIRQEIDTRTEELPPELRPLLAKNLRELAQLITTLSDNRSKPFIRSDDTIERQLVTGEQSPQAALDVMRWLSGYLDGIQRETDKDA